MKFKGTYVLLVIIAMLVLFTANDAIAQCSMCRKIATDGTNTSTFGNGLNKGILYLLAMPYLFVALFFRKQIFDFVRTLTKK